jgi:hypothetical protein
MQKIAQTKIIKNINYFNINKLAFKIDRGEASFSHTHDTERTLLQ